MTSANIKGRKKANKSRDARPWAAIFAALGTGTFFLLLCFPALSASLVRDGLRLCALTVIPSLFPFMALSEIIIGCLPRRNTGKGKTKKTVLGLPAHCLFAIILGILCGAPVGAKCASSLYRDSRISSDEYSRLLPLCNIPSAPFVICAVGELTFKDRIFGLILYASCVISALLCGYISGAVFKSGADKGLPFHEPSSRKGEQNFSAVSLFCDSVCSAAASVISICAFVTFFYTLVGILRAVISVSPLWAPVFFGFFEMTGGTSLSPSAGDTGRYLAAAVLGWSGLSVHLQVINVCRGDSVSFKPYILSKILSFAVCPLIVLVFYSLLS